MLKHLSIVDYGKTWLLQTTKFFNLLFKYVFHYIIKYSKQIWVLFVSKLYKNIQNTGVGESEKMHCVESCFQFS